LAFRDEHAIIEAQISSIPVLVSGVSYDQSRPLQNLPGQSPLEAAHGGGRATSAPLRTLSYDDVTHYGKIVVALKETM
jgi:hypothetical protein